MGAALGRTRNSIIGRIARMGIEWTGRDRRGRGFGTPPKTTAFRNKPIDGPPKRKKVRIQLPTAEASDLPVDESAFACTLIALSETTCHWPMGDPCTPEFMFCGAPKPDTTLHPYCDRHHAIAYRPYSRRH